MSDYPPPPMPPAAGKASAIRRLGARVVDGFVLIVPLLLVSLVLDETVAYGNAEPDGMGILAGLLGTAVTYGYYIVMESNYGGTLGKKAFAMSVHDGSGQGLPTVEQAAKRNLFMLVGVVPYVGGLLSLAAAVAIAVTISNDPEGRGFHDRWAGALVSRR